MRNRCLLPVVVLLLLAVPLFADTYPFGGPFTTDNDDSCDISNLPAATLLLPYFEVDLDDFEGETTLFTVTNVGDRARVVRVTLWTDVGFPVVSFNIYLTGYDVQSINLRDIIGSGRIGTEAGTGTSVSPFGPLSRTAGAGYDLTNCTRIPHLSPAIVAFMQSAFTTGYVPVEGGCTIGREHTNAVGYATMDVVGECTGTMPIDSAYFRDELRYENVLMGEYQQLNPSTASAQGGTMVHIRAIPEGRKGEREAGNLPRTFYQRLTSDGASVPVSDARQPLPSTFFARWINGGPAPFQTSLKIWRELSTRDLSECDLDDRDPLRTAEIVLFDEAENAFTQATVPRGEPPQPAASETLPASALVSITDLDVFPIPPNGAQAGWVYLNLDNRDATATHAEQAWVISSMRAEGRYSVDMDATAFGNGCSPRLPQSEITEDGPGVIGPAPNVTP